MITNTDNNAFNAKIISIVVRIQDFTLKKTIRKGKAEKRRRKITARKERKKEKNES